MHIYQNELNKRVVLMTISLSLFFTSSFGLYKIYEREKRDISEKNSQIQGVADQKITPGVPVRLIIPSIGVDTAIQPLGVTEKGEMEVPSSTDEAGWLMNGYLPGSVGSAVIAGHLDGVNGEEGVFANLYMLKKGDLIFTEDDNGGTAVYVVRDSQVLNPGYADEVFSKNDDIYLNLVTCDGVWDVNKKSYNKRLVVYSDGVVM